MRKLGNHRQKYEIEFVSYTTHKINSKWVNDLNIRTDTVTLLEENTGGSLLHFGPSNDWNQAVIKVVGRNINNLMYVWYHSNGRKWRGTKEPLDEGERGEWKASFKLNIQNTKIMASSPITSWQIDGEKVETDFMYLF